MKSHRRPQKVAKVGPGRPQTEAARVQPGHVQPCSHMQHPLAKLRGHNSTCPEAASMQRVQCVQPTMPPYCTCPSGCPRGPGSGRQPCCWCCQLRCCIVLSRSWRRCRPGGRVSSGRAAGVVGFRPHRAEDGCIHLHAAHAEHTMAVVTVRTQGDLHIGLPRLLQGRAGTGASYQ